MWSVFFWTKILIFLAVFKVLKTILCDRLHFTNLPVTSSRIKPDMKSESLRDEYKTQVCTPISVLIFKKRREAARISQLGKVFEMQNPRWNVSSLNLLLVTSDAHNPPNYGPLQLTRQETLVSSFSKWDILQKDKGWVTSQGWLWSWSSCTG